MNRYTIYCTEEQTKKALELGAKISWCEKERKINEPTLHEKGKCYKYIIPTAEQMIGWLEGEGYIEDIVVYKNWKNLRFSWTYDVICCSIEGSLRGGVYYSRK